MVILKPLTYTYMAVLALLIALGSCEDAHAQDYLNLTGPNPTGCAIQRNEMMTWAQEGTEPGSDLSRYRMVCDGPICVAKPKPLTGRVKYQTEYGEWVVNYGGEN